VPSPGTPWYSGRRAGAGAFGICNLKSQISDSNPLPDSPPEYRGRGSLLAILFSDRHRPARRDVATGRAVEAVDRDKRLRIALGDGGEQVLSASPRRRDEQHAHLALLAFAVHHRDPEASVAQRLRKHVGGEPRED